MSIEQEIRDEIDNIEQLKIDVGDINNHLSALEELCRDRNQKAVEDAYKRGYDNGYKDKTNNDEVGKELASEIYQRGLNDAWEAARKIVLNRDEGGTSTLDLSEIFDCVTIQQVFRRYTVSEVIAKLKDYEEKQEDSQEIKVGDEVAFHHDDGRPDTVVVVTYIGQDGFIDGMDGRGTQYAHKNPTKWTKTGRHFDIEKILEEMKE